VNNDKGMSGKSERKSLITCLPLTEMRKETGLGLAIARQIIVEKHGGAIKVKSKVGQETEFILTLLLN
jgi:signal transduction histidine kinase